MQLMDKRISRCVNFGMAEELPAGSGRTETEKGFRGTRLLTGLLGTAEPPSGMEHVAVALVHARLLRVTLSLRAVNVRFYS
jgi:hypothetical protein